MRTSEAAKLLNVRTQTVLKYIEKGLLRARQLETGRYIIDDDSVYEMLQPKRNNVVYARVSSRNQRSHLDKQVELCKQFMVAQGLTVDKVYSEVASGLDLDRKQLQLLMNDIMAYKVKNVVITFPDRLSRIGFKMLEQIFARYGCNIITVDRSRKSEEQEILDEIVAMLHVYSSKLYGTRRKHVENVTEHLKIVKDDIKHENSRDSQPETSTS